MTIHLTAQQHGQRADLFLAKVLPDLTRSAAQKLLEEGRVYREDKPLKKNQRLDIGDQITVVIPDPVPLEAVPQDIPLDVVFEDEDVIVVNKPVGLVVHPAPGHPDGTLVNALLLDINASSVGDGSFHIPLSTGASAGNNDLLTFREPAKVVYIDPYEEFLKPAKSKEGGDSDMRIRLNIQANPDIQALIELDKDAGNILSARGNGQIQLDLRPRTDLFQINGDYTLTSGSFNYNALGFTNRLFKIDNGSSIRFAGDLMESDLDIGATYSTKTSVGTLIADTSSVSTRRLVNCHIQITDKLKNPELNFSIDVPDLDPATKTRVESALNTDDKIQKQFLSLLISGSFMPDEQSGIVNNTNLLYSNLAEVMATQLNTILERLDIPLDLGLTYQESAGGTNIFDVAVSTQLFNNRVLVNGTLGNRQKMSTSSGSDVVGDLDIEIKLDRPGQFRLKLFSHSADDYTNYLDYSQRNGVGITWQREFSSFKEFVRDLFSSKRKRAARAASDTTAREQVILEIKP